MADFAAAVDDPPSHLDSMDLGHREEDLHKKSEDSKALSSDLIFDVMGKVRLHAMRL